MKRLFIVIMLLLSITLFAEKLTTDGNHNLDKLKGIWESLFAEIIYKNGKWYYISDNPTDEETITEIKIYKKGVLIVPNLYKNYDVSDKNLYFAYDTKYRTLVTLDKNLNIIDKERRRVECFHNGTCN